MNPRPIIAVGSGSGVSVGRLIGRNRGIADAGSKLMNLVSSGPAPSSLLTGLQAYYSFETLLADSTANANTLTNNAAVTQNNGGIIDKAANFVAASSQYLSRAETASLQFTTALSISQWFYLAATGTNYGGLSKGSYSTTLEWYLRLNSGAPQFFIGSVDGNINGVASSSLSATTWNHIAIVYDGSLTGNANRCKMWLNGVAKTLTFAGTVPAANTVQGGSLVMGQLFGASIEFMNGRLDETGLWNVALTPTQIADLYNAGAGVAYPFTGVP